MSYHLYDVRLSHPQLYQARIFQSRQGGQLAQPDANQKATFQATLLIPHHEKDSELGKQVFALMQACYEALKAKHPQEIDRLIAAKMVKWPFKDTKDPAQNTKMDGSTRVDPEFYRWYVRCSSTSQPLCTDRYPSDPPEINPKTGKPMPAKLLTFRNDRLYPGCWVRAAVNPGYFNHGTPGVGLFLNAIQHWKDDERIDNRTVPENEFDADESGVSMAAEETVVAAHANQGMPGVGSRSQALSDLFGGD